MSLQHLRTFLEVYRHRSLTEAARRLSLTQPAVSQQVASLEAQVGRALFWRGRRGVRALPAADDLAAALGSSLDHAEAVLAAAKARSVTLSGVVHIAGPAEYIGERFTDALARLADTGIQVRVQLGGRDAIYAQLLAGDVDIAVTASTPSHRQLDHTPIAEENIVFVAPSSSSFTGEPADLISSSPYVAYDTELPLIRQWCAANKIELPAHPPAIVIPDLRTLATLVKAGAGWSVLPDYLLPPLRDPGPVRIAEPGVTPPNSLHLVWVKGSLRHPRIAFARNTLMHR